MWILHMTAVHRAEHLSYEGQVSDATVKRILQGLRAPRLWVRRGLGHEIGLSARGRCGSRVWRVFTALWSVGITGNGSDNAIDLLFTVMHVLRRRERDRTVTKIISIIGSSANCYLLKKIRHWIKIVWNDGLTKGVKENGPTLFSLAIQFREIRNTTTPTQPLTLSWKTNVVWPALAYCNTIGFYILWQNYTCRFACSILA